MRLLYYMTMKYEIKNNYALAAAAEKIYDTGNINHAKRKGYEI